MKTWQWMQKLPVVLSSFSPIRGHCGNVWEREVTKICPQGWKMAQVSKGRLTGNNNLPLQKSWAANQAGICVKQQPDMEGMVKSYQNWTAEQAQPHSASLKTQQGGAPAYPQSSTFHILRKPSGAQAGRARDWQSSWATPEMLLLF